MNLKEEINAEAKKYGAGSGNSFKFEGKGVYKMRLLVQPKVIATHFFGKGNPAATCIGLDEGCPYHKEDDKKASIKLVTYIIDRRDEKVKLAELPLSMSYSINDLQEDQDFAFTDFPMPYDVKVTYEPDNNDPKAIYRVVASPNRVELTDKEETELSAALKKMTPERYVESKKEKQKEVSHAKVTKTPEYPEEELNAEVEDIF